MSWQGHLLPMFEEGQGLCENQGGWGRMGPNRVYRGGSWNSNARNVRAAYRNGNHPGNRNDNVGFRLARVQERAGEPTPDPTFAPSSLRGWQTTLGARRASRVVDSIPKTRRCSPLLQP